MAKALADMPLARGIKDALLGTPNQPRHVLDAIVAYEQGHWDDAAAAMDRVQLSMATLPDVYADALHWARGLSKTTKIDEEGGT